MRLDHLLSKEKRETERIPKLLVRLRVDLQSLFNFWGALVSQRIERDSCDGGVAQLGEHLLCKQGVIGSSPFISTIRAHSSVG